MQAAAKSAHRRSRNVPARLPERVPVPVLGLELATEQGPARRPQPGPDSYPGLAAGARPRPSVATGPGPAAQPPQPAAGRGRRGLMLAVCCLSLFMVGLDNTIVNVGLPDIGRDLHGRVSALQWTVAAYTIALRALLMLSGAVADPIGRGSIFQVGLSLCRLA